MSQPLACSPAYQISSHQSGFVQILEKYGKSWNLM